MQKEFTKALLLEWDQKLPLLQGKTIYSIYFGGGTPSQLAPHYFDLILKKIFNSPLSFHQDLEVTLEANPEDISKAYLSGLQGLRFNRLSLGVQSLHDPTLKLLNRQHDSKRAIEAVIDAHTHGFSNISIDLMYDLPSQTLDSWQHTLSEVEKLPITHLSLYNLTIEPNTPFYRKRAVLEPTLPKEALSLTLLESAVDSFERMGLERYEISAFAKKGYHSKHNTGYWLGRSFLGYGPSAFSYYHKKRFRNCCDLKKYISHMEQRTSSIDFEECLEEESSIRELLAIHLRLKEGVDLSRFPSFSQDLTKEISSLIKENYLQKEESLLSLTEKGFLFYDTVATAIV